eukprot:SAG25_NODE_2006_length_2037_cov_1.496388_1_plen_592_part_10
MSAERGEFLFFVAARRVCELLGGGGGPERMCGSAWLALFALCWRNGLGATVSMLVSDAVCSMSHECVQALGSGDMDGTDGVMLMAAGTCCSGVLLGSEMGSKSTGPERATMERVFNDWLSRSAKSQVDHLYSGERTRQLLPAILEVLASEDLILASTTCCFISIFYNNVYNGKNSVDVLLSSEVLSAVLAVRSRIAGPPQHTTVEWWAARTEVRSLETACLIGPLVCACMGFAHQAMSSHGRGLEIPPALNAQWREMISEAVHIAKMIHQLVNTSTQPVCVHGPAFPTIFTMRALVYVSSIPPQRKALASPGLIKALLHIVEHDNTFGGHSTAAYAAMTAVNLIGREEVNEGGLTLTRQAVDKVIQQFMSYFDLSSRRASYPVVRMLVSAKILAHLIIPDTNKTFVIEHDGALDCLVLGLLLDASDPRRLEEGAVELQWTCAMILQNLALIASGVGILRTHSGTMEGLRELASTDSGAAKSEKARQCAVGAMFELEAEKRRAVLTMGSATAIEHIMLSYNWDHQAVIKRVNASLVRRGYTTWIDVEKMQGSTVEAMADAVEGAAAMCYGVSRAYKESANCRLEAQYAYQREK